MSRPLDTIVELQGVLRELQAAEARLSGIPDWMKELHAEHTVRQTELNELQQAAEAAAHERRLNEGNLSDSQEKLKHYQQQIGLVRTQREYGALLQEIDAVKVQIKGFEDAAFQAMERESEAQKQAAVKQQDFAGLDQRYATELAKWESEKPSVAREVDVLRGRADVLRERVPAPVLSRFQRLFNRYRGEALAPVKTPDRAGRGQQIWCCGACNWRVRPQAVVEIRNHGSLVECDSCKRILYIEEAV